MDNFTVVVAIAAPSTAKCGSGLGARLCATLVQQAIGHNLSDLDGRVWSRDFVCESARGRLWHVRHFKTNELGIFDAIEWY
jgi:hypothetical protein